MVDGHMLFWITAILLTLVVGAVLAAALLRPIPAKAGAADIHVYRDQLKEVDRDLTRGVISESDAEALKLEVSRRLLAADKAQHGVTTAEAGARPLATTIVSALLLLGGGVGLYWQIGAPGYADLPLGERIAALEVAAENRPGQASAEAQANVPNREAEAGEDYLELVRRLRTALETRPDSAEGFLRLARAEAILGNFRAAHLAQARLIDLKGADAAAGDYATHAELLISAAGGYVSPEAQVSLDQTLIRAPDHPAAQYYYGLLFDQTGRPDRAFRVWRALLEQSVGDEPWVEPIRLQIEDVAERAGIAFELPPMMDGETNEMVRGMVSGLAERLASQGGSPEEWARLIRAYGVLGETENAQAVWDNAQQVFADTPDALSPIRAEAERAGVAP